MAVGLEMDNRGRGVGSDAEGVRDDGIVLLEIGELGPGPTMFRPWDSPKRYSEWLPWLVRNTRSPNRAKYQRTGVTISTCGGRLQRKRSLRSYPRNPLPPRASLTASCRSDSGRPSARSWSPSPRLNSTRKGLASTVSCLLRRGHVRGLLPHRQRVSRPDVSGRELPWPIRGSSSSAGETDGDMEVRDLPEAGELEVG